jgi:hypothetical protein
MLPAARLAEHRRLRIAPRCQLDAPLPHPSPVDRHSATARKLIIVTTLADSSLRRWAFQFLQARSRYHRGGAGAQEAASGRCEAQGPRPLPHRCQDLLTLAEPVL